MRVTILFLGAIASIGTGFGCRVSNAAGDLEVMTATAVSKWKAQREGIVTGRFSVRVYRYLSMAYKHKIAAKECRALIEGKSLNGLEAALGKLQSLMGESSIQGFRPHWGDPIEITCEGIKCRNEWKGSPFSVYAFNGNEWLEYQAGIHQATIRSGRQHLQGLTIENLCDLPKEPMMKQILDSRDKRIVEGGKVMVDIANQKFIFDPASGFIDQRTIVGRQNRLKEIRQASPIRLEGGFIFPQSKATVEYEGDYVRSIEVLLIDSAELNGTVSPDTFVVSTPGKTRILDTREKVEGTHPIRRVDDAVADVLAFANAGEVKRIPEREFPAQRSHNRWLYALLTLPLVVLTTRTLLRRWKARLSKS